MFAGDWARRRPLAWREAYPYTKARIARSIWYANRRFHRLADCSENDPDRNSVGRYRSARPSRRCDMSSLSEKQSASEVECWLREARAGSSDSLSKALAVCRQYLMEIAAEQLL